MLKTKECKVCSKTFTNERKNGGVLGDKQFSKSLFCSLICSGIHQRGIHKPKHTEEWKKEQSERLKRQHALGIRKGIFTEEVRRKMSESAKNKPPMSLETRKKISEANTGEKSYAWKGDKVGYHGLHAWVEKQLGRIGFCSYCGTKSARKYEWASIGHSYKRDLSEWVRLCTRCHRHYDYGRIILDDSSIYRSISENRYPNQSSTKPTT